MRRLVTILENLKRHRHFRKPLRVLVVDDDAATCQFVRAVLTAAGHDSMSALSGDQALALFETDGAFDVLLTDLMMPQMLGDELARRIRLHDPSIRVLYLTGYPDRLFELKTALWQDEAYLEKPCTPEGLIEAVSFLAIPQQPEKAVWA